MQKLGTMYENNEIAHTKEKESIVQSCILDSLLSQPANTKSLENHRSTYSDYMNPHIKLNAEQKASFVKGIVMEHCYARPYSWRSDANFLRPTKSLLITQDIKRTLSDELDLVDVESVAEESPPIYDTAKAKRLMDECQRHVMGVRDDDCSQEEDCESKVVKINWSEAQHQIFDGVISILNADRMARLAYAGVRNEAILRRNVIDKSVQRFRKLLCKFSWDFKLVQWLHQILLDNLSVTNLAAYLDILQTVRQKIPSLTDKMLHNPNEPIRIGALSIENLHAVLMRPWDPVGSYLSLDKSKVLPNAPVLVLVPSVTSLATNVQSKRLNRWIALFSSIATVATVHNSVACGRKMSMMNCVDQMFAATRAKVQEVKAEFPNRAIVLIGFNSGASLALQVAQVETVLSVVCLGFSIYTGEGNRGDPDDNLLELQSPVLFVIGQCSNTSLQEHLEDVRERMRVETGLLVVGGADDYLRVKSRVKRSHTVSQALVDRSIVLEVSDFLTGLLLSPYPPQIRQSPAYVSPDGIKRPKVERKRNTSNCSSLDSEPPSPTAKVPRPVIPVGRPPGSKAKSKIEAKWHAMQQGTSCNTSNNIIHDSTPSTTPPNAPCTPESDDSSTKFTTQTMATSSSPPPTPLSSTSANLGISSNQPDNNAKLQAMGLAPGRGFYQGGNTLTNLLSQGGVRTLPPNPNKHIKVLDNISITPPNKMVQMNNRSLDLNKCAAPPTQTKDSPSTMPPANYNNIMLLPDGRYKGTSTSSIRGNDINSSQNVTLTALLTNKIQRSPKTSKTNKNIFTTTPPKTTARASLNKYITSKKQLLANRNKPLKKMSPFMGQSASTSQLVSASNLTTQDIMDLPIIFADDNQMLANNTIQPNEAISPKVVQSNDAKGNTTTSRKFVFVNKQPMKRPSPNIIKGNTIKYTKIIISKADESKKTTPKAHQSSLEDTANAERKMVHEGVPLNIDLESELKTNTIPKRVGAMPLMDTDDSEVDILPPPPNTASSDVV